MVKPKLLYNVNNRKGIAIHFDLTLDQAMSYLHEAPHAKRVAVITKESAWKLAEYRKRIYRPITK